MEHIFVGCGRPVILFFFFSFLFLPSFSSCKTIYSFGWCKIRRMPTTVSWNQRVSHRSWLGHDGARASPKSLSTGSPPRLSPPQAQHQVFFLLSMLPVQRSQAPVRFSLRGKSYCLVLCVHASICKHSSVRFGGLGTTAAVLFGAYILDQSPHPSLGPALPWPCWDISGKFPSFTELLFSNLSNERVTLNWLWSTILGFNTRVLTSGRREKGRRHSEPSQQIPKGKVDRNMPQRNPLLCMQTLKINLKEKVTSLRPLKGWPTTKQALRIETTWRVKKYHEAKGKVTVVSREAQKPATLGLINSLFSYKQNNCISRAVTGRPWT